MSGFCANLLSRSRGTAAVVRPRLASLFEPGAPRVSHAAGAYPAGAQSDAVTMASAGPAPIISSRAQGLALSRDAGSSRSEPHARRGHDSPSHDARHVAGSDADTGTGAHGHAGEDWDAGDEARAGAGGMRRSGRADGGAADGRRHRGDRAGHADRTAAAVSAAAGGSAVGDDAAGEATSMAGAGAMGASAMRATPARALGTPTAVSRRPSGTHDDAAAGDASFASDATPPAALIAAARPPASLAPMPVPSSTSRLPAGATASRSRAEADAGEPVIEISIGRIDVRAAVERGSARQAAAASASVMGLDEYLQTHARARGGSR